MNQVASRYPGWPMISSVYPTRDRVMPWRLFVLLAADLKHHLAAERLLMTLAIVDAVNGDAITHQSLTDLAMPEAGAPIEPQTLFRKE